MFPFPNFRKVTITRRDAKTGKLVEIPVDVEALLARDPGIDGYDIMIILHEIPMINWGVRGGQAASDVEMGFKVVI